MDAQTFERLLYEEEGTALDFKSKQYPFANATEEEKSELLKDILGFVNAFRRSDAFILIGVEDVRGGRSEVIGIPEDAHLPDHSLQQFVNNLTVRPVLFHYEAFGFEGKQVGIIRIDMQPRPMHLKHDYGNLKRSEVYVRRGSSTDPTKPAGPDEVARMGSSSPQQAAEISIEFAQTDGDAALGPQISLTSTLCEMPPSKSIPDLEGGRTYLGGGLSFPDMNRTNRDFYREFAAFEFDRRLFRGARFAIKNIGQVSASNVRVELVVPSDSDAVLLEKADLATRPSDTNDFSHIPSFAGLLNAQRQPGRLNINTNAQRIGIQIDCGDLQPGRLVYSDVFFIGKKSSGTIALMGQLFADNLPTPKAVSLAIAFEVDSTRMSLIEMQALSHARSKR